MRDPKDLNGHAEALPPRAGVAVGGPDLQTRDERIGVLRSDAKRLISDPQSEIHLDRLRKTSQGRIE